MATYNIYRNNVLIGTSSITSYVDSDLTNDITYTYKISYVNSRGEETFSNTVSATPHAPPAVSGVGYGSLQGDSRSNNRIGGQDYAKLSYRFRATTTSTATGLKVQQRGGSGYSLGDGGTIRVSIQQDSGGLPSGNMLGSFTFNPGNPGGSWETWPLLSFPTPVSLTSGVLYHLVFENIASDPYSNYISFNILYLFNAVTPRQPAISDDFAVFYGNTLSFRSKETPIFDLIYTNGVHDGLAYIGAMIDKYAVISGASNMARERFTVSGGDKIVTGAAIRVRRTSGTSPLTIRLESSTGTLIEEGNVSASSIPISAPGGDNGGAVWAAITFNTSHTLVNGTTYNLRAYTAADTEYTTHPLQEGGSKGLNSWVFSDGEGQKTTDGSNWVPLYAYDNQDLQFYFTL